MPVQFGDVQSKAHFIARRVGPRGAKLEIRSPHTLDGELCVAGGRGGRDIVVLLHFAAKSKDAALAEVWAWMSKEGREKGTLTIKDDAKSTETFTECVLASVSHDDAKFVIWDSELNSPGYQVDPVLTFRQISVPNQAPAARGGFGA